MNALVQIGLTNALVATALAVLARAVGTFCRRPALAHALWLLVLVKLVTPPLIVIPVALPESPREITAPMPVEVTQAPPLQFPAVQIKPAPEVPLPEPENPPVQQPDVTDVVQPIEPLPVPGQPAQEPAAIPAAEALVPPVSAAFPPVADPVPTLPEIPWAMLLTGGWLAGSAIWFAVALVRIWRFQYVLKMSYLAPTEIQHEASELAARMGLRDCPSVWLVPAVVSPMLWAVSGFPRLLLPTALLDRLDMLQRRTLLAHELAHYRRRDHWVRCLEFLALGIYWWFPVVWWARRELREAEEECCDAWVVWTLPEAPKAYANALVETLDFLSGSQPVLPPVASGLGQLDLLRRRLTMIMRGSMPRQLGALGALAVVALGLLLLPLVPSWAYQGATTSGNQQGGTTNGDQQGIRFKTDQGQPGKGDLDKARADLKRAAEDLERFAAELQRLRDEFERKAQSLKKAQDQLRQAEKAAGEQKKTGGAVAGGKGGAGGGTFGVVVQPGMDQRLAELERKVDAILQEVRELRKSAGKGPLTPGVPGTPLVIPITKDGKMDIDFLMKKGPGAPGGPGGGAGGGGGGKGGAGGGGGGKGGGGQGGGAGGGGQGGGAGGGGGGDHVIIIDPTRVHIDQGVEKKIIIIDPTRKGGDEPR